MCNLDFIHNFIIFVDCVCFVLLVGLVGASGLLGPETAKARNGTLNNWVVYPILLVAFCLVAFC